MNEFEEIVHVFLEVMRQPDIKGTAISLPTFDYSCLTRILTSSYELIAKESNILELSYPIFIVGNINGSLFSLFEILKRNGVPPVSRYLFIGNCIGNEEFSYQCFIFILAMKLVFPNHIFIIRGQNEFLRSKYFRYMQLSLPLKNELSQERPMRRNSTEHNPMIDSTLLRLFDDLFASLPLAAKVFDRFLCVNRSIPISLTKLANVDRHKLDEECQLFQELYGNASNELITHTEKFEEFFEQNSLTMIIRGSNYVGGGVFTLLDGRITEIFSGINQNDVSAILDIIASDNVEVVELSQIPIIHRREVDFVEFASTKSKQEIPLKTRQSSFNGPVDSTPIYLLNHPHTHFQSLEKIKKITRINKVPNQPLSHMKTQPFFDLSSVPKPDVRSFPKRISKLTFV